MFVLRQTHQNAMEMLFLGARVLTIGRSARVETLVDPFLVVVIPSVRFSGFLTPIILYTYDSYTL